MHAVREISHTGIKYYAWTDSAIVLAWLSSYPARWKTFVANRTCDILDKFPRQHWAHVRSSDNPADHGSRGVAPLRLVNLRQWWEGPEWLKTSDIPCSDTIEVKTDSDEKAIEKELSKSTISENVYTVMIETEWLSILFERKSRLSKIFRIVAYIRRYKHNLTCRHPKTRQCDELQSTEVEEARVFCLIWAQNMQFEGDLANLKRCGMVRSNSRLVSLAPFVDEAGVLRVGGRLFNADCDFDSKHPAILAADHVFTERMIWEVHNTNLHAGPTLTNNLIKQKYWIVNGRAKIRSIIKHCVVCVKYAHKASKQLMGNLPRERVTPTHPFINSGIDFAGPIYFASKKGRGSTKPVKGYICVFVCLSVKAIHLEPVSDLTSDAFLAALKRFTARRGVPKKIYTDNGSNFIGAKRILNEACKLVQNIYKDYILSEFLSGQNIEWHFIPPHSPHIGGLWESAVKSVKTHLLKAVNNINLTFEEMATLLCQIENILNSRPLYTTTNDEDYEVLTPAHFLIGTSTGAVAETPMVQKADSLLTRWQRVQRRIHLFWKSILRIIYTLYNNDISGKSQQRILKLMMSY